jgi:hypothetical protein
VSKVFALDRCKPHLKFFEALFTRESEKAWPHAPEAQKINEQAINPFMISFV